MMTIRIREAARRDLVGHFVYLAEQVGIDTADRFLENAEATFASLLAQPQCGVMIATSRAECTVCVDGA